MARLSSIRDRPGTRRGRLPKKPAETARCCDSPKIEKTDSGSTICMNCFTQISHSDIVAEVTFEENTGGRATVQGGTVAENSRHARTMGPGAFRRIGGGERNTLADIQNAGRRALQGLAPKLGIEEPVQVQAESIWGLAAGINFSAGRRTDEVIAACLYAACRRQRDNKILLMDIAELVKINVFRLGEVYKDLCKELYLNNESVGHQYLQELEPLIKKYCDKLQFEDKTKIVAEDALKIIRRMNRDWIVAGRHPAGLCGACIILAARMNNFRRSVREVVYVSKVCDATIAYRIQEFRRTKSSALTVEEFRQYANRIKHQHNPPSFSSQERARLMENRKRRRDEHMRMHGMVRSSEVRESEQRDPVEIPDDATDASSRLSSLAPDGTPALEGTPVAENGDPRANERPRLNEAPTREQNETPAPGPAPVAQMTAPQVTPPATQESPKRKRQYDEVTASSSTVAGSETGTESPASKRPRTDTSAQTHEQDQSQIQDHAQSSETSYQARRIDADGFAIPSIPASASQNTNTGTNADDEPEDPPSPPRKRGRPRREEEPPTIELSQEELDVEDYLEKQIEKCLENNEVQDSQSEVEKAKEEERIQTEWQRVQSIAAEQQRLDAEKNRERREAQGQDLGESEEDLEKQFENDPEVVGCLLSPEEVRVKEQIWVAHNEDWLRKQAEKEMLAKVAKATGASSRGRKSKKGDKDGKKRKKRSKMGDGSVLTESSTPIQTPADAARAMLEKRMPQKSSNVDYSVLSRIYNREPPSQRSGTSSPDESGTQSKETTPVESREPSATPAPSEAGTEITAVAGAEADAQSQSQVDDDLQGEEQQETAEADEEDPDQDQEQEDEDADEVGFNENPAPDDEDGENDYNRLYGNFAQGEDEFGTFDLGGYDGEGEEYE